MADYVPEVWVDDSGDGSSGTAVSAAIMNNIEEGIAAVYDRLVPIGSIRETLAVIADDGWMMLEGQALIRSSYADLFDRICPVLVVDYTSSTDVEVVSSGYTAAVKVGMTLEFNIAGTISRRTVIASDGINLDLSSGVSGASGELNVRLLPWGALNDTTFFLPDHRGRMSMHADSDSILHDANSEMGADGIGGAVEVVLTTGQLPAHTHSDGTLVVASHTHSDGTLTIASSGAHQHELYSPNNATNTTATGGQTRLTSFGFTTPNGTFTVAGQGAHTHDVSGATGGASPDVTGATGSEGSGQAHNNMSPYAVVNRMIRYA